MMKLDSVETTNEQVHQQSELLVMDYLRGSRCMKTMDALSKWISEKSKKKQRSLSSSSSPTASDIFAKDVSANKSSKDRANSVLEYMIGTRKANKSPKVSCSPDNSFEVKSSKVDETKQATSLSKEWTKAELSQLKKEAKKTQNITDKTERWKIVGAALGRSKRDCYEKYKELRKKSKEKSTTLDMADEKIMLDLTVEVDVEKDGEKSAAQKGSPSPPKNVVVQYGLGIKQNSPTSAILKKNKIDIVAQDKATSDNWCHTGETKGRGRGGIVVPGDARSSVPPKSSTRDEFAIVEDCDDFDQVVQPTTIKEKKAPLAPAGPAKGSVLSSGEVAALRKLLFNDTKKKLSSHWVEQGFSFSQVEGLTYGIVQHEGGPCGVMAVVQAYVLYFLLKDTREAVAEAKPHQLQRALIAALTHIIWQATSGFTCSVALKGQNAALDQILVSQLHSRHELEQFLTVHINQYMEPKGYGAVLLVASVMLSRGLSTIESDMDSVTGSIPSLIGAHDYCTQEMVNLLLLGYACSNVFDGTKDLGDEKDTILLRGVQKRSLVGFLTLFEAYDYMVVGGNLKTPHELIWVICSESHYSVFFADPSNPSVDDNSAFDLFYFDGLANQDEVIRLTVDPIGLEEKPQVAKQKDLTPPLNLVIQTKWPRATINWNGVDPLL